MSAQQPDELRQLAHELRNTLFATRMLLERALEHEELGTDPIEDVRRAHAGVEESLEALDRRAGSLDARPRFDASQGPRKLGPDDGPYVDLGALGVRFMIWGEESGGGFALVEHPIPPRSLCAPLHRHSREDEYSFVVEGRMGAQLGDEVVHADAGELAFKPRDQWHTFWNAGDEPCRILELISPAGFEHYFRELGEMVEREPGQMAALAARYGLEFQIESIPRICAEHGLTHPLLAMFEAGGPPKAG